MYDRTILEQLQSTVRSSRVGDVLFVARITGSEIQKIVLTNRNFSIYAG